jgi:hypothetical protein
MVTAVWRLRRAGADRHARFFERLLEFLPVVAEIDRPGEQSVVLLPLVTRCGAQLLLLCLVFQTGGRVELRGQVREVGHAQVGRDVRFRRAHLHGEVQE